jgi:Protein of unknown function (DUF3800)
MNIFIDESGTFVDTDKDDSWNCVAAYVVPEFETRKYRNTLGILKRKSGFSIREEIKLKQTTEENYFKFLSELNKYSGVLFCVATDSGKNHIDDIKYHQKMQVDGTLVNVPKMHYQGGKDALTLLAKQLSDLSPQLYVQLHCQVSLIYDIVNRGKLYFVQRYPKSLSRFRWRIDQKNTKKIDFEDAFEKITPALLQSRSIREPMITLEGADYRALKYYEYPEGEAPTYLKDEYGIDVSNGNINLGRILREDLIFADSKDSEGVQVADLLASGIRRCMRSQFSNNEKAAKLLGKLMVAEKKKEPPLKLIGFQESSLPNYSGSYSAVKTMINNCRPMLTSC